MAKNTNRKDRALIDKNGSIAEDPYAFVSLPFKSILDVYERIMSESLESWTLNIKKNLLSFETYHPHTPLRKIDLSMVDIKKGIPRFKKEVIETIKTFDRLLKNKVVHPGEDYSQLLTHLYYGLSFFSIGVYDLPSHDGQLFINSCQKLRKNISEQEKIIKVMQNHADYLDLSTRRGSLYKSEISESLQRLSMNLMGLELTVKSECITDKDDALLNREYGVRLVFDAINNLSRHLSIPEEVDELPVKDRELEGIIKNYKKEKREEVKENYYRYAHILTFEVIALIFGSESLAYSDVGKIIDNRKEKKIKKGKSIGFKGAKDTIFSDMDEAVRKGVYRCYQKRLQDEYFEKFCKHASSESQTLLNALVLNAINNNKQNHRDIAISLKNDLKANDIIQKVKSSCENTTIYRSRPRSKNSDN